jgi:hypothetical protein
MSRAEELLLLLGVLAMIASWVFRIRLFTRYGEDRKISELTQGTYATTFVDFLTIKLFRARADLPNEAKVTIFCFIALHWAAFLLMVSGLTSYFLRS